MLKNQVGLRWITKQINNFYINFLINLSMKKYFILSAAALALASCSNDEFLGEGTGQGPSSTSSVIAFGSETGNATRANFEHGAAAEKLNNNFIVYGFKYYNTEPTSKTDVETATKQQTVFDLYNVNYTEGTANTTESNTAGWEYVGLTSLNAKDQSIKYWDYSADGYVFSAVSGTGVTPVKIENVANGTAASTPMAWDATDKTLTRENTETADKYDKGWVVTIPQGGSLSDLYASERVEVAKAKYQDVVSLKFYNMGAKVRFAMYEIIPGYEVHIDKFYYTNSGEKNSETNFAVDGNFTTLKTDGDSKLIVTYYNSGTLENHPKVTPLNGAVTIGTYGVFGTNIQATDAIGTNSTLATYDQNDKSYTDILPMTGNGLTLKVDYTLTSTDGSNETIHVKGATAKVPANFTDWKANFAYTYLFKISDNTNGSTGKDDSDNDVIGLYPITFDALVVGNEDGIQETITSVSDPSITTYQNGEIVTKNNEYVAGDIFFEDGTLTDISGYKVYEVNNLTGNTFETQANMTEEVVANYLNNFCVLTEIDKTDVSELTPNAGIPMSDGTYMTKPAKRAYVFKAEAGKTYAIANGSGQYKVVKVQGGYTAPSFTAATEALGGSRTTASITAVDGTATLYLSEEIANNATTTTGVVGAMPSIAVTTSPTGLNGLVIAPNATAGRYDITVNDAAVYAGTANGTYTLRFGGATVTITVNIATALRNTADDADFTAAAVTAGDATGVSALLKINDTADNNGVIVNDYTDKGVVVTNTSASGLYKITATQNAVPGVYNVTIAGKTVAVTVTNYAFAKAAYEYTLTTGDALIPATGTPATIVLNVLAGNAAAAASAVAAANVDVTGANLTLTGTGTFTPTAAYSAAGGEHTLTYANTAAKATVTVNKYAIDAATIARSTGRVELGVTVNGNAVNASAAKVKITNDSDSDADVTSSFTVSANGQKIVISGAKSTLATGAYTVHYYLEAGKTNEVATSALTVN